MSSRLALVALAVVVALLVFLCTDDGAIRCAAVVAVALSMFLPIDQPAKGDLR